MSINNETIRRLANDVKYLLKNPLTNENIFYKHDEENILKGYALLIGNNDTPYAYGYYFFEFNFTENYPYEPPKVIFLTNDGKMRFNPNLYTNGKVCLSVLNTWKGEGWTSCQSIYSILLILSTVLSKTPLLNEPGINEDNPNIDKYNLLISYKNIEYSIIRQTELLNLISITSNNNNSNNNNSNNNNSNTSTYNDNTYYKNYHNIIYLFQDTIRTTLKNNYENIKKNIEYLEEKLENINEISISTYNLRCLLNVHKFKKDFNKLKIDTF